MTHVAFAAQRRCGKSEAAQILTTLWPRFRLASFAAELRRICAYAFDVDESVFFDEAIKEQPVLPNGLTPRDVLRFVGTEIFRTLDKDVWVRVLMSEKRRLDKWNSRWFIRLLGLQRWLAVQDLRFLSEALECEREGLLIVGIRRPSHESTTDTHQSEAEVLEVIARYAKVVLINNGTLEQYRQLVSTTLRNSLENKS